MYFYLPNIIDHAGKQTSKEPEDYERSGRDYGPPGRQNWIKGLKRRLSKEPEDYERSGRAYGPPGRQNWIKGLKLRILRRVTESQKLDLVEGSTPSEAEKGTVLE
jgi:hypothetical protein